MSNGLPPWTLTLHYSAFYNDPCDCSGMKDIEGKERNPLEAGVKGRHAGKGTSIMRVGLRRKRWVWERLRRWMVTIWCLIGSKEGGGREGGWRKRERERSQRWFPGCWLIKLCEYHLGDDKRSSKITVIKKKKKSKSTFLEFWKLTKGL